MLEYCDYIADKIKTYLREDSYRDVSLLRYVDKVNWDLHPEDGYMLSTKKTIKMQDKSGKWYKVTVETL